MAANLFRVETGFSIDDNAFILYGVDDPTSGGGVTAPPGSLYLRDIVGVDGGEMWIKTGDADTAWEKNGADVTTELGFIRTFIGKDSEGNVTPDYSSNNVVTDAQSLETAIGDLDAEIGAAVTGNTRTNSPISDQAINLNIEALDDAIGSDTDLGTPNYVSVSNNLYENLAALDTQVKDNYDAIQALEAGLRWIPSVRATTSDDISSNSGTTPTFSDDNIGITYQVGDRIASSFDDKIYVVNAGTWTVATDGNLATGDSFFSTYAFIFSSDSALQGPHAVSYNGADLIKLAQFDFEYANTIMIATGYTAGNGTVTTADTIQSALQKLDGNQQDIQTTLGVAQGAVDLGTFTGSTIQDNRTVKQALQDLETQVDTNVIDIANLEGAVGSDTGAAGLLYTEENYVTDGESLNASVDALDVATGKTRLKTTSDNITTIVALDSVSVDDYIVAKWMVVAYEVANPENREAYEVFAMHDGTTDADATAVDYTKCAKLKLNSSISGLSINVDLNGTDVSQVMRLTVASTAAVNARAIRMAIDEDMAPASSSSSSSSSSA